MKAFNPCPRVFFEPMLASALMNESFEQLIISPPIVARPDSARHVGSAFEFALGVALQIVPHMCSCGLGDIGRCRSFGGAPAAYALQIQQMEEATDHCPEHVGLGRVPRDKKKTDDEKEIESLRKAQRFFLGSALTARKIREEDRPVVRDQYFDQYYIGFAPCVHSLPINSTLCTAHSTVASNAGPRKLESRDYSRSGIAVGSSLRFLPLRCRVYKLRVVIRLRASSLAPCSLPHHITSSLATMFARAFCPRVQVTARRPITRPFHTFRGSLPCRRYVALVRILSAPLTQRADSSLSSDISRSRLQSDIMDRRIMVHCPRRCAAS